MFTAFLWLVLSAVGSVSTVSGQISGEIELTVSRDGAQWKADAKITAAGQQRSTDISDVKVTETEIAFTGHLVEAELRFSGRLNGDRLSGKVEAFQGGSRIAIGTWSLMRQKTGPAVEALAGNWLGTFDLQASGQLRPQQQGNDPAFDTRVARPAYPKRHPKVLFDEAHSGETSYGTYKPFSDLITSDGFSVVPNKERFSRNALKGHEVLVIVNASGPQEHRDVSPFSDEECDAVRDWVKGGGALLLITDQAPFSAAASDLSGRFGVGLTRGYTIDPLGYNKESEDQTELVFTRDAGLLGEHAITQGRDSSERINRIITFTGTSLKGPEGSVPFLKLADTAMDVLPPDRKPSSPDEPAPDHRQVPAAGRAQGVALEYGKGRVVVLGEAAMLTAQVATRGFRFGMNVSGADNRQLALNVMHWLSRLLK